MELDIFRTKYKSGRNWDIFLCTPNFNIWTNISPIGATFINQTFLSFYGIGLSTFLACFTASWISRLFREEMLVKKWIKIFERYYFNMKKDNIYFTLFSPKQFLWCISRPQVWPQRFMFGCSNNIGQLVFVKLKENK